MNPEVCGKIADKLQSRGFGRRNGKCLLLSWVEFAYLCERGIIKCDFSSALREASHKLTNFDIFYLVYRDLRDRGYVLEVRDTHFRGRKNYSMNFYPMSDMDYFRPEDFLSKEFPLMLAVVDTDGEVTYYLVDLAEPRGEYFNLPKEALSVEILGKRTVLYSPGLIDSTTFGRSEGEWGHLSVLEAMYLWEKGLCDKKPRVKTRIYRVYRDLRENGLIVKSGFKYGTHFRAYEKSMEEHSKYLVHVISRSEEIQKISRAVRVAHGVRKILLLSYLKEDKIVYFKVSWVRP